MKRTRLKAIQNTLNTTKMKMKMKKGKKKKREVNYFILSQAKFN